PNLFSERAVIGLLLLAVMALPFVTDLFNIGERPPAQFALGSVELGFFNAVDSIQAGTLVLVAAEYGTSGAAELADSTDALLRHILARGGVPVLVSGDALGLLRAENLLDEI